MKGNRRRRTHGGPARPHTGQRALNQRLIVPTSAPVGTRNEPDACPVCGAGIAEEGGLGCCGAITATCEGSINGAPVDWDAALAHSTEEDDDTLDATVTYHNWYVDTGEEAPDEMGRTKTRCRCERTL